MRVAIAGGTGLIGTALTNALLDRGDEAVIISRRGRSGELPPHEKLNVVSWDGLAANPLVVQGIDAIVNLSGETINQRWTTSAKQRILRSRQLAASKVANLIAMLPNKPKVVVNASAISVYGTGTSEQLFDEASPTIDSTFLAAVIGQWENAADAISSARLVRLRTGVVLAGNAGAFPLMAMPYKLFAGGKIGTGKQGLSWIHIEDMARLILFCLDHEQVRGVVNGCAPEPVSNDSFGRAIAKATGRPHWLPVPSFAMKLLFGEMSSLLLEGQYAMPNKALKLGFKFRYPDVESAVRQLVGKDAIVVHNK